MKFISHALACALLLVLPDTAAAVTVCASGCDHTEIAAAARDTDFAGEDIEVGPGTYMETGIDVEDRNLVATDGDPATTIIDGSGGSTSHAVRVMNGGVSGFTIRGAEIGITDRDSSADNLITLTNLVVEDNGGDSSADGGVKISYGAVEIEDCIIRNNSGTVGAGITINSGQVSTITGSTIEGNTGGGGISVDPEDQLTITDATIQNNEGVNGGGIAAFGALTLENVQILNNTATNDGGGIYKDAVDDAGAALTITGGVIDGNMAKDGGGINLRGTRATLTASMTAVTNNTAEGEGGGVHCRDASQVSVEDTEFGGNDPDDLSCVDGGGGGGEDDSSSDSSDSGGCHVAHGAGPIPLLVLLLSCFFAVRRRR